MARTLTPQDARLVWWQDESLDDRLVRVRVRRIILPETWPFFRATTVRVPRVIADGDTAALARLSLRKKLVALRTGRQQTANLVHVAPGNEYIRIDLSGEEPD